MTIPELLFQIESDMLLDTIKFLKKGKATPATWKADRLKDLGTLNASNVKLINKYKASIIDGSTLESLNAQKQALNKIDTIYDEAVKRGINVGIPKYNISPTVKGITEQFSKQGGNDMNYTMQSLLNGSKAIYKDIIQKTAYRYSLGDITLDEALQKTCSSWINQGGIKILDSAGRNWSAESYSRLVLYNTNRNITTNVQLERNKEYGNDLIEISSHAGARELCAPYQGKIYSQTGKNKSYPPLSSTSYGEPAGIFGINCHHDAYPYIEGLSSKRFDPNPFDEKEYNLTQEQRALERDIRNNKRALELQKELGNTKEINRLSARVSQSQANMRSFIDNTGRTRYYNRERIFT